MNKTTTMRQRGGPILLKPLAVAVACAGAVQSLHAAGVEEVVVTATRREQAVQDIPYNISVMSGEALRDAGISDLPSLARQIPGFTFLDLGPRSNGVASGIILRGLNASAAGVNNFSPAPGNPTVMTYLNETPLFVNLKIADVQRVEVLKGPQGTLYGAGSVGGTVRFVYNKPSPDGISGDFQGKISQTTDADDLNYSADGVFNLPISDTGALRFSSGYERTAGVIDATHLISLDGNGQPVLANPANPNSPPVYDSKSDVDEADVRYFRGSLLVQPAANIEALLTYHHQRTDADDFMAQNPITEDREHRRFLESPLSQQTDLYSLEVTADLGFATLTSASARTDNERDSDKEATGFILANVNSFYGGYPRPAYVNVAALKEKRTTQELRLVSANGGNWDWLVGGYYSRFDRSNDVISSLLGYGAWRTPPAPNDAVFELHQKVDTEEKAFFGELTYHISDAWQVTGGVRYFDLDDVRTSRVGIPNIPLFNNARSDVSDTGLLTKFNTSYRITDNLMAYFTRSEGYRQGGANPVPTIGPFRVTNPALIPYEPDEATNWEVGIKGSQWDWLGYSVALYQIDWEKVQIQLPAPGSGIAILVNGNDATSRGAELEVKATWERLQIGFGYSYNDAELDEDFFITNSVRGFKGDQLPGVPDHQLTASIDYAQPISPFGIASELRYHLDTSYRNGTKTALNSRVGNYAEVDGFTLWNAALTWTDGSWRAGAFINNIFDEDGITAVDYPFPAFTDGSVQFISRPRTVGLMLGYSFK